MSRSLNKALASFLLLAVLTCMSIGAIALYLSLGAGIGWTITTIVLLVISVFLVGIFLEAQWVWAVGGLGIPAITGVIWLITHMHVSF
jgi:hypothetical protein